MIQETARTLQQFKSEKCKVGVKPLLSFSGAHFDSPSSNSYTLAKSMLTDFFRGGETKEIDVEGLQLLISFSAGEDMEGGEKAKVQMRCWKIVTKRSGQKVPRIEVEEMGPRMDFRVGRIREAEQRIWKESMKMAIGHDVSHTSNRGQLILLANSKSAGEIKKERGDRYCRRQGWQNPSG